MNKIIAVIFLSVAILLGGCSSSNSNMTPIEWACKNHDVIVKVNACAMETSTIYLNLSIYKIAGINPTRDMLLYDSEEEKLFKVLKDSYSQERNPDTKKLINEIMVELNSLKEIKSGKREVALDSIELMDLRKYGVDDRACLMEAINLKEKNIVPKKTVDSEHFKVK